MLGWWFVKISNAIVSHDPEPWEPDHEYLIRTIKYWRLVRIIFSSVVIKINHCFISYTISTYHTNTFLYNHLLEFFCYHLNCNLFSVTILICIKAIFLTLSVVALLFLLLNLNCFVCVTFSLIKIFCRLQICNHTLFVPGTFLHRLLIPILQSLSWFSPSLTFINIIISFIIA